MPNTTLKTSAHTNYSPIFADWDVANGNARLGTEKTIDNQLPGRIVRPSLIYYVGFIAARINAYIIFPDTAYLYAGFWLNNGVDSYWVQGTNPFTVTGAPNGSPATTIDRKYRIFARTDRATSFLSTELDIPNAPSDAAFAAGASVSLLWDRLGDIGIISYDVYRKTGATYQLLQQVESGVNNYLDNNVVEDTAAGYPTATDDRSIALTTTRTLVNPSVLNSIFIDGVSPQWSTLSFPIRIPFDFDSSLGDEQFLRIGIGGLTDGAADLRLPATVVSGTTTITTTQGLLTAAQVGLDVTLTDDDDVETNNTISGFTDTNHATLGTPIANGTYTIRIMGGAGNHSLLVDCVHSSFGNNATFSNNDADFTPPRLQFPRAAPNGSNQGGTGDGSGGDGGFPTGGAPDELLPFE